MLNDYENFGDVSPQHGQTWIRFGGDDYADVVEILSGSDAGLADNQFMVRRGSVYFSPQNWDSAMSCCDTGIYGPPTYAHIAYAFYAYEGFDQDSYGGFEIVQVGSKPDDFCAMGTTCDSPDTVLHGNASIEKYIRQNWLV
jgi:hypothetical protein